jgi:hypothetical protein
MASLSKTTQLKEPLNKSWIIFRWLKSNPDLFRGSSNYYQPLRSFGGQCETIKISNSSDPSYFELNQY